MSQQLAGNIKDSKTDQRVSVRQHRMNEQTEDRKIAAKKGESCASFLYRQNTAFQQTKQINRKMCLLGEPTEQSGIIAQDMEVVKYMLQQDEEL